MLCMFHFKVCFYNSVGECTNVYSTPLIMKQSLKPCVFTFIYRHRVPPSMPTALVTLSKVIYREWETFADNHSSLVSSMVVVVGGGEIHKV